MSRRRGQQQRPEDLPGDTHRPDRVAGALAGALTGGLVTWSITQDQLSSQKAGARRTERLEAYAQYFGDAARLWMQAFTLYEVTPPPKLSPAEAGALKALEATVTQEYARVALLAPDRVHSAARALNDATTQVGNALEADPIDAKLYAKVRARIVGTPDNLLQRFASAARADLGSRAR